MRAIKIALSKMFPPTKGLCIQVDRNLTSSSDVTQGIIGENNLKSVKIRLKRAFPKQNKVNLLFWDRLTAVSSPVTPTSVSVRKGTHFLYLLWIFRPKNLRNQVIPEVF